MQVSFKELTASEQYKAAAANYSKAMMFASTLTVIIYYFVAGGVGLLTSLIVFVVWCLFGVSVLLALPMYMVKVWLTVKMAPHAVFPSGIPNTTTGRILKLLSNTAELVGLVLAVMVSWALMKYLSQ